MNPADMNGNRFVAVDFICKKCADDRGKRRRMTRFGLDTFPGADPDPWETRPGQTTRTRWTETDKALLYCKTCGHEFHPHRDEIIAELKAVPRDTNGHGILRHHV